MKRYYIILILPVLLLIPAIAHGSTNPFGFQGTNGFSFQDPTPEVRWEFDIPASVSISKISVQDIKQREVFSVELKDGFSPGKRMIRWNGTGTSGKALPDGIYYLSLQGNDTKCSGIRFPVRKSWQIGSRLPEFQVNSKSMSYNLPKKALVMVRYGLNANQLQALCYTAVNWEAQDKGLHTFEWNANDIFRGLDLKDNSRFTCSSVYYELPEGAVVLDRGIGPDDAMMDAVLAEADLYKMHNANIHRYAFERGDFELAVQHKCKYNDEEKVYEIPFSVDASAAPFGWLETPGLKREVKVFVNNTLVYRKVVDSFPFRDTIQIRDIKEDKDNLIVFNAWDSSGRFGYFVDTVILDHASPGKEQENK